MSEDVEDKGEYPLTVPRKGRRRESKKDVGLRPKTKDEVGIGRSLISMYREREKKYTHRHRPTGVCLVPSDQRERLVVGSCS